MALVLLCVAPGFALDDTATTRIVSLVPALTETCFAIGAGDQVVGVSDYCLYPPEAQNRPHVGGLGNPRLEQLLLLRPNVVLLYRSQADFARKLEQLHVPARLFSVDRLEDVYKATQQLGSLSGRVTEATELEKKMRDGFAAIQSKNETTSPVRALVLVSRDSGELRNLYQAGPQNFLGQLMQIAGGTHAIPAGAAITKEQIILANPQVIIDLSRGESAKTNAVASAAIQSWQALSTVDAVKNHRVHILADPHALVPGPYLVETAEKFEQLLHE